MIFTGIDSGDEYTVTVSEVKNSSINGKFVEVVFEIDGDVDTYHFSENSASAEKWVEDHTGTQDAAFWNEKIKTKFYEL